MEGTTTWVAQLTPEQIADLRKLLDEDGWLAGRPEGSGTPHSQFARVIVRGPQGTQSYRIRGHSEALDRLLRQLDLDTRGRHDEFMRRVPSAPPRMDEPDPRYDQE